MCMRYKPIEIDMTEEVKGKGRETARSYLRSYQTPIAPSTLPTQYFLCPKNGKDLLLEEILCCITYIIGKLRKLREYMKLGLGVCQGKIAETFPF